MKVITEIELRERYKIKPFDVFNLEQETLLTPAASQYLNDRRIHILRDGVPSKTSGSINEKIGIQVPKEGYLCHPSGKAVKEKPEHYTHLKGKILVPKSHKRIKFRGKLDLSEAYFVSCIIQVDSCGYKTIAAELAQILEYLQDIMRAEVCDKELPFIEFNGWSDAEVREYSHYPSKYFGVKYVVPSHKYGPVYACLNQLRAMLRELEIAAVEAFYNENEDICERLDIVLALNRLSSIMYISICKFVGGHYNEPSKE